MFCRNLSPQLADNRTPLVQARLIEMFAYQLALVVQDAAAGK